MAITTLLLGPIQFQNFELPAAISWGGAQQLTVHQLPGGTRVIDAMGRDDADITWSGIFSGENAALRAQSLDLMRGDGALWPLTWNSFFYSVVIARFEADQRRPNWIPYRIVCKVLRDETAALVDAAISAVAQSAADLAQAALIAPTPAPANLDAALLTTADLTQLAALTGQAAQTATATGYLARAARN